MAMGFRALSLSGKSTVNHLISFEFPIVLVLDLRMGGGGGGGFEVISIMLRDLMSGLKFFLNAKPLLIKVTPIDFIFFCSF